MTGDGEHFGGDKAGPVAAPLPYDDRPFDLRAVQHGPAVEQLRCSGLKLKRRAVLGRAACQHNQIGLLGNYLLERDIDAKPNICALRPALEILDRQPRDRLVRRAGKRVAPLAAEPIWRTFEEDNVGARRGADGGATCRPTADDHDLAPGFGRPRQRCFTPCPWVDRAIDWCAGVVVTDAGLVTTCAALDLAEPAAGDLVRQLWVGDHRARHTDRVGLAASDHQIGDLRIGDPRRRDHRHADHLADAAGERCDRLVADRRRRSNPG